MNWNELFDLSLYDLKSDPCPIIESGMSAAESWGRWSCEKEVALSIRRDVAGEDSVVVIIELLGHVHPLKLKKQRVTVSHRGVVVADWDISDYWYRLRGFILPRSALLDDAPIDLHLSIPDAESPAQLGVNDDTRTLGIAISRVWVASASERPDLSARVATLGTRFVGTESRKTWDHKHLSGFWNRFIKGPKVLDIGFSSYGDVRVVPIMDGAIGVDIDYPGYDGKRLPFEDFSQDAVYSSHCLEHISDPIGVIQDWYRVTKLGGHIIIAVPSRDLFERRRRPPSAWNVEHLRMYTCASLLAEIEAALEPNSFKVRYMAENDDLFDYTCEPGSPPYGNYEITVVIEKIRTPDWRIID